MKKMIRKFVGFTTSLSMLLYPLQLHAQGPAPAAGGDSSTVLSGDIVVNPDAIHAAAAAPGLGPVSTDLSSITGGGLTLSTRTDYVTKPDEDDAPWWSWDRLKSGTSLLYDKVANYDYSCFSCTLTRMSQSMKYAFPLSSTALSLFSPLSGELANANANACIKDYESNLESSTVRSPSVKLCACLDQNNQKPLISSEDIKKFEDDYMKNSVEEYKKRFEAMSGSLIDDFNELRAATFYDRELNIFSRNNSELQNDAAYEALGMCQVDFSQMIDNVHQMNPTECSGEGAQAIKNIVESKSSKMLPTDTGRMESRGPSSEERKEFLGIDTQAAWTELSANMLKEGGPNQSTKILATLDILKSLRFDPIAIREVNSLITNGVEGKKVDLQKAISTAYNNQIQRITGDLVSNDVRERVHGAIHAAATEVESGGVVKDGDQSTYVERERAIAGVTIKADLLTENIDRVIAIGGAAGSMFREIDRQFGFRGFGLFKNLGDSTEPSPTAGTGGGRSGSGSGNGSGGAFVPRSPADRAKRFEEMSLVGNYLLSRHIPHTSLAFKNISFDGIGVPSQISIDLDRVDDSKMQDPAYAQDRLNKMRDSVCKYPNIKEKSQNLCEGQLDGRKLKLLFSAVDLVARGNMMAKCGVVNDRMLNFCRAFSGKKPKTTAIEGMNFLHEKMGSINPSPFNPPAKNEDEHKLKVSQLSCFLANRDRVNNPTEDPVGRCEKLTEKYFTNDAISYLNSSESGFSCKSVQGSMAQQAVALGNTVVTTGAQEGALDPTKVDQRLNEQVVRGATGTIGSRSMGPSPGYRYQRSEAGADQITGTSGKEGAAIASSISGEPEVNKTVEQRVEEKPGGSTANSYMPINPYDFKSDDSNASRSVAGQKDDDDIDEEIRERDRRISGNDRELEALKARLAEAERKLGEAQSSGDKTTQNSMQELIAQLQADRKKMQDENNKMKAEVRQMMAERSSRVDTAPVPADIKRIGNKVGFLPASATPTPAVSSGGIVSGSGSTPKSQEIGIGGSSFSSGNVNVNRGGFAAAKGPDDFGFQRQQVMTLSAGELTSARFVAADKKEIFSSILSKPSEPVFVRENGMIVKYVAQLDEEGKPLLDKDGNPILKEYLFTDPEAEKKVVDKKTEPKKTEPKKERKPASRASFWDKALEDLKSGSGN